LFDVQTGEFLVRPSTGEQPLSADDSVSQSLNGASEPLNEAAGPQVMPWEQSEELPQLQESAIALPASTQETPEISADVERSGSNELPAPPIGRVPSNQDLAISLLESDGQQDKPPVALSIPPVATSEPEIRIEDKQSDPVTEGLLEPAASATSSLPAPMPWEEMADATVQIPDAEPSTPPASDAAVESSLAAPGEELRVPLPSESFEPVSEQVADPAPAPASIAPASVMEGPDAVSEPAAGSTSSLPTPMPWEEVADATLQIPETEPPSPPPSISSLESMLAALKEEVLSIFPSGSPESAPEQDVDPASAPTLPEQPSVMEGPGAVSEPMTARTASTSELPSPMPWEEMADATVQIPDTEPFSPPTPEESVESVLAAPSEEAQTPSHSVSPEAVLEEVTDPAPSPTSLEQSSATEAQAGPAMPAEPERFAQPAEEAHRPTSVSWNSVFDSAWKFAVGAPGSASASETLQENSQETQDRKPEPGRLGSRLARAGPTFRGGLPPDFGTVGGSP
jgi:hypothetical protein